MRIPELETALREARERALRAVKALAPKHRGGEVEEFRAAREEVLQAERSLAAAKGEPYAVPVEFPVSWDTGAPLPYLLRNDYRTFLTFFVRDIDPNWDGSYVAVRDPGSNPSDRLAVVEFECCICTLHKNGHAERGSSLWSSVERKGTCRIPNDGCQELDVVEKNLRQSTLFTRATKRRPGVISTTTFFLFTI